MTDFYSLLEKTIKAVRGNPERSRQVVYDLARYALKNKIYARDPNLTAAQVNEQMIALELAIALVEAKATNQFNRSHQGDGLNDDNDPAPPHEEARPVDPPEYEVIRPSERRAPERRALVVLPPRNVRRHERFENDEYDENYRVTQGGRELRIAPETAALIQLLVNERKSKSRKVMSLLDGLFRVAVVAVIGFGIYAFWSGRVAEFAALVLPAPVPAPPVAEAVLPPPPVTPPPPPMLLPNVPMPKVFGVYAIHEDRLVGLQTVPTTPVDPRTRNLLQITAPSQTVFDDGRLAFTVYRRDLVTSAPEKVPVRFAARIASTMRYGPGGTLVTVKPDVESWLIYTAGFDFRVLPVPDNQEVILIRPSDPDLVLPPGRYVLLLNDQPYDFTVAGNITDPRSCVEGVATPRGPVFYVCKTTENP
jgi:hypothetical protein